MINAPASIVSILESGNFNYANLVTVNLGDAYDTGFDIILYLTDFGHSLSIGGNTFISDNNLTELSGISRKASTGSDAVDVVFSVTDPVLLAAIKSERYINKPTSIDRVIVQNGLIVEGFTIPVRTAWGLSHSIAGDIGDRSVTLVIDSTLGDMGIDNGWYAVNSSHEQRYANDKIMNHGRTVMTEEQQAKYTTNFNGVINQQVKPPALPKIYGYKNVEAVPICMLKHRKTHTSYRHYFTTMIYAVNIGSCDYVDIKNMKKGGDDFDCTIVTNNNRDVGGWSARIRTPDDALSGSLLSQESGSLSFWFEGMDSNEIARMNGMVGKGLTLLFLKNRNRDDWLTDAPKITMPVRGAKVFDPRSGLTSFSRNPALQYADYLRSTEYGAGKRGVPVSDANISELADHFDTLPDSVGNDGINEILIDVQIDTSESVVDNMNIWMTGVRLFTSDYYGEFRLRVEKSDSVNWEIDEADLVGFPDYESGKFTDKKNQLTYTIKQLVKDNSEDAEVGDLVEVDVEATFPADGSTIHQDWLEEDGGIPNFDSQQLDYVTVLEQAFYWAMVDARISRKPRELELPVGAKGWLSEVGDIISYTSEIMDMTDSNNLWRIEEVSEDGEETTLSLVAFDANFYTPDPTAIPDPVAAALPPTGIELSTVSGMAIVVKNGKSYLDWQPLSATNVSWYAIEVYKDGVLTHDNPKVAQPPLLLDNLTIGDYQAKITAIGINDEGGESLLSFAIAAPIFPSVVLDIGIFNVTVNLSLNSGSYLGVAYNLMFGTTNVFADAISKGTASQFTLSDLKPETGYFIWTQTTNLVGVSDWNLTEFTTKNNTALIEALGEVDKSMLAPEVNDLIDQLDRSQPNNIHLQLEEININTGALSKGQTDLSKAVFDTTSAYANFRQNYEIRTKDSEIEFSKAKISINENEAQIILEAERITASEDRLVYAEATLIVQAGQITQKASFTEVDAIVASAIDALVPAYSWQYNSDVEGFTGQASWNALGFIVSAQSTITSPVISYDATENPMYRIRARKPTGGTWNGILTLNDTITLPIPEPTTDDVWEVIQVDANGTSGYAGTIIKLVADLGDCDIDYIEVGKRGASDQALTDITARTSTIEQDINAGTGSMSAYATTVWVNNLGYQTESNVGTLIDTFDTTYSITATLEEFTGNDTLAKANGAFSWIDGNYASITEFTIAYNAQEGGIDSQLSIARQDIDALNGEITNQVTSISGLSLDAKAAGMASVIEAYNALVTNNKLSVESLKVANAEQKLSAQATEQESTASSLEELTAQHDQTKAQTTSLSSAFANEKQATATSLNELSVEMSEGDTLALASAKEYTQTSVGYCVDANGAITNETNAVLCVGNGDSWVDGVLSEFIRNLQVSNGTSTASLTDIRQVIGDDEGNLVARGAMLTDVGGRISGFVNTNDGSTTNFDIGTDKFRIGIIDGDGDFIPLLTLDTANQLMNIKANLILGDGTSVESESDIRALDGTANSIEQQYSATSSIANLNLWHYPMVNGDVYVKQRVKTQKGNDTASYSAWSTPAEIKGDEGNAAVVYKIRMPDGTGIKNSTGTVQIYATKVEGAAQTDLTSGNVRLYKGATDLGFTEINNATTINGSLVIELRDDVAGITYDSVTLTDVTDGIDGYSSYWEWTGDTILSPESSPTNGDWVGQPNAKRLTWVQANDGGAWSPVAVFSEYDTVFFKGSVEIGRRRTVVYNQANGNVDVIKEQSVSTATGYTTTREWNGRSTPSFVAVNAIYEGATLLHKGNAVTFTAVSGGTKGSTGIGIAGARGAGMYGLTLRNGVFPSDITANADMLAELGFLPVIGDILTYRNATGSVISTKEYSGSTWVAPSLLVNGAIIATGSISGESFKANTLIQSPKIEFIGTTHMRISSANGFGSTNQFIEWFGANTLINGVVDYASLTKANAITYLTVDGDAYFGGAIISGTLQTSKATSEISTTASVDIEIGSNGGLIAVNYSINLNSLYSSYLDTETMPTPPVPSCVVVFEKFVGVDWEVQSTHSLTGTSGVTRSFYDGESGKWINDGYQSLIEGFTFMDSSYTTTNKQYRLRFLSISNLNSLGYWSMSQRLSLTSSE